LHDEPPEVGTRRAGDANNAAAVHDSRATVVVFVISVWDKYHKFLELVPDAGVNKLF
jgi:hypothetical protein